MSRVTSSCKSVDCMYKYICKRMIGPSLLTGSEWSSYAVYLKIFCVRELKKLQQASEELSGRPSRSVDWTNASS